MVRALLSCLACKCDQLLSDRRPRCRRAKFGVVSLGSAWHKYTLGEGPDTKVFYTTSAIETRSLAEAKTGGSTRGKGAASDAFSLQPTFHTTTGRNCSLSEGNTTATRTSGFHIAVAFLANPLTPCPDGSWRFEIEVLDNTASFAGAVQLGFTTHKPAVLSSIIPTAQNLSDLCSVGAGLWRLPTPGVSTPANHLFLSVRCWSKFVFRGAGA